jgi:hypothetical protein
LPNEQKSVARQIDHARQYARSKGWTVDGPHESQADDIRAAQTDLHNALQRAYDLLTSEDRAPEGIK